MCGIAGVVFSGNSAGDRGTNAVAAMCARMRARGPDAERITAFADGRVTLGHRRLAIIDLDVRATQPMRSADGRFAIVFNGEIYNYRELRRDLEAHDVHFATESDTEVLLALFAREGKDMLPRLRGMFAFAIWDERDQSLFLARDAYGIKPLYWAAFEGGFAVASQVKALMASGLVSRARDPAGLAGFYLWGSVPEPLTLYRYVKSLPAGHFLVLGRNGSEASPIPWNDIRRSWCVEERESSISEVQDVVRAAMADSVRFHLVADVPVSVFLSGGIDSSVVSGLISEAGHRVEGITIGFQEFIDRDDDEVPAARLISKHFGIPHHVHVVTRAEFDRDIPHILDAMDQPSVDGINTWFAAKAAASRGYKVVLSGVGGDELFCGYRTFSQVPKLARMGRIMTAIPGARGIARVLGRGAGHLLDQAKWRMLPILTGSIESGYCIARGLFFPEELPGIMGAAEAEEGLRKLAAFTEPSASGQTDERAVGSLESTHYLRNQLLRDSDWASMAHSIELRTPLVDTTLLGALAPHFGTFVAGQGKRLLAGSLQRPLPAALSERKKTGFSIPSRQWLGTRRGAARPERSWARYWALELSGSF